MIKITDALRFEDLTARDVGHRVGISFGQAFVDLRYLRRHGFVHRVEKIGDTVIWGYGKEK